MAGVISSNYHHPEVSSSHAGVRMKFWGVCCVGGKAYKQVVNYRFHLTMAVLDPKSFDRNVRDKTVTLSVIQHGKVFLLCVLRHGEIQQVNLNLIFDKGDDVTFSVGGYGTVNLTGYTVIDSQNSRFDMDNEHYCPVAELGSEKQIHSLGPLANGNDSKLRKALKEEVCDSDDDDSDFSASAFVGEAQSSSEEDSEGLEDDEMSDSEIKALKQDMEDDEKLVSEIRALGDELLTPLKSERSQKRKIENTSYSEKRIKQEIGEPSHRDDQSDSDEGYLNSSIGNTPMPKMEGDSLKARKKLKKKKRLSEISNISKTEKENVDSPKNNEKPTKSEKQKHPVIKLEGGVECQDVTIGRGPVAKNGKIVSIFYMGRLENKSIFDARTAPEKPFSFKLGVPEVIKGLDIGINGMKVGGQRKLKIPAKMGYGSKAVDKVPANSTLFFNIELMSVN